MVVLAGLEVVGAVAAVSAIRNTERGARFTAGIASMASTISAFVVGSDSDSDRFSGADAAALSATPGTTRAPATPIMQLTVRPRQLPRLMIPPGGEVAERCVMRAAPGVQFGDLLSQLASAVPRRFGDAGGEWYLLHSTSRDGTSLAHMLRSAAGAGPCVLLVRDTTGRLFGAFLSELREPASTGGNSFYGCGETFLFAFGTIALPPPPLERGFTPAADGASPAAASPAPPAAAEKLALFPFRWTKRNDHFICCTAEADASSAGCYGGGHTLELIVGAGGGGGGLVMHADLERGSSAACDTFGNNPLPLVASGAAGGAANGAAECTRGAGGLGGGKDDEMLQWFECETVELWGVDETACRNMRCCRDHVAMPAGE